MKQILLAATAMTMLVSCAGKQPKSLILYYSQTGATEKVAEELQKQTGADIERFDVAESYDGDYMATISRVQGERATGYVPALVPLKADLSDYDIIYLAYPVWFGTYAPPVQALIQTVNLDGKTIVPVCTFGSGGLEASTADLVEALPQCSISSGFGIRNARIQYAEEELDRFLIENAYKEGQVDPLPDYSERREMTEEELSIYNEATGSYPYPMGEASCVSSRKVQDGTDYIFIVATAGPDGSSREGKVYVSVRDGRQAEFTRVDR